MGRTSGGRGGGSRALARTAYVPSSTGAVLTLPAGGLKAPVLAAKTGGSANLTIPVASTRAVLATVALAPGASQTISGTLAGADGVIVPFSYTLTGIYEIAAITTSVADSAAPGAVVASITGVPPGQSPAWSGDNRLAIGGSEGAGWKLVVGLGALIDGATITGSVSATGATSAAVSVSVQSVSATWRIAATRGEVPALTAVTSGANLRRHARATAVLGEGTYFGLRVIDGAFYVDDTNNEVATAGYTLKRWIEIPGAPTPLVAVTYGGLASVDVASGAVVTSDDISPASFGLSNFAPGTVIRHRLEATYASGATIAQHIPHWRTSAAAEVAGGDGTMLTDATVSAMGTINATGFTASSAAGHGCPMATIGLSSNHGKHLLFAGDSISYGAQDDYGDGRAGGGPLRRACYTNAIPYIAMTRSATLAADYLVAGRSTRRAALVQYALHGFIEWSTNDLNGGASAATTLAAVEGIAAVWRAAGMTKVYAWETLIRTNASNVPASAFGLGGARDTYITSLRASTSIDGTVDPNPAVESSTTPRTWSTLGSSGTEMAQDGTHPKPPGNAAIVALISADMLTAAQGGGL